MDDSEIKKLAIERLHEIKTIQYKRIYAGIDEDTRQVRMDAIAETLRKIEELSQ